MEISTASNRLVGRTYCKSSERLRAAVVGVDHTDTSLGTCTVLVEPDGSRVVCDANVELRDRGTIVGWPWAAVEAVEPWSRDRGRDAWRREHRLNHVVGAIDD